MDYSEFFARNYNTYDTYLDIVLNGINVLDEPVEPKGVNVLNEPCTNCFTTIDDDLYTPKGYNIEADNTHIIFDSGCSVSITPFAADFVGPIQPSTKTIGGFTGESKVEEGGIVNWTFRDNY